MGSATRRRWGAERDGRPAAPRAVVKLVVDAVPAECWREATSKLHDRRRPGRSARKRRRADPRGPLRARRRGAGRSPRRRSSPRAGERGSLRSTDAGTEARTRAAPRSTSDRRACGSRRGEREAALRPPALPPGAWLEWGRGRCRSLRREQQMRAGRRGRPDERPLRAFDVDDGAALRQRVGARSTWARRRRGVTATSKRSGSAASSADAM